MFVLPMALGSSQLTEAEAAMDQAAWSPVLLFCSWRQIPKAKGSDLQPPNEGITTDSIQSPSLLPELTAKAHI